MELSIKTRLIIGGMGLVLFIVLISTYASLETAKSVCDNSGGVLSSVDSVLICVKSNGDSVCDNNNGLLHVVEAVKYKELG